MHTRRAPICTGASSEHYRVWESRRAWFWGVWLPLACLLASFLFRPWGWAAWLIYPLQFLRQIVRNLGDWPIVRLLALFQVLARFPEGLGQIRFMRDRLLGPPGAPHRIQVTLVHAHRLPSQPIPHRQPQLHPARDPGARAAAG